MKLFRISNVLLLCLASALGSLLFWASQSVQEAQDQLADLNQQSQAETDSLLVLSAEWDYLNRPQRLEELASDYLNVVPGDKGRVIRDANALPVYTVPATPPGKPHIIPAVVHSAPAPSHRPSPVIQKNDSEKFDALLQSLSEGDE